ncbi:MAG: NAD(P)H-hydrate dehydratase [Streptococcaceae bacterium]|jgi:hydroxyethylthiazole kinase-like uncharacterized protein yjeF|nr:NAD(P)H-hydrate dehydratase [Streptococcaceae bacterium]
MEITREILPEVIKRRKQKTHKGNYGRVVILAGDNYMGGAAILATKACVFSGAGLTTLITSPKNFQPLHAHVPESMVCDWTDFDTIQSLLSRAAILLIGPGLGQTDQAKHVFQFCMERIRPHQIVILDGDGLSLFKDLHISLSTPENMIFTPHQQEFSSLTGLEIAEQTTPAVQKIVDEMKVHIVLKSSRTEIFHPHRPSSFITNGTPAQATGGMGDTLAGMIAGFHAQFKDPIQTLHAAVFLHSHIASSISRNEYVSLPSKMILEIPAMMSHFEGN